jgi:ABC-2 type transport system permease protein
MILTIIKYEWRNLAAERSLWIVALLFAVSIGYAAFNGFAWVRFQEQTIANAAQEESGRYDALMRQIAEYEQNAPQQISRFSDPRDPAAAGRGVGQRYAAMPPAPLAPLSIGQSDLLPYYFKISTRSQQTFIANDEIENPTNLLAGRFDIAFVIVYLLPLLIFAVSYNFLSGEREAGTLQMLLSQPLGLTTLIAGKIVVRLTIIAVLVIGLTFAAFLLGGGSLAEEAAVFHAFLWTLAVLAYIFFWFALAVAVNIFKWSSATNAVALVGCWLLFVVLIPSLANVAVTALYPMPSRVEMINAMRDATSAANKEGSRILARYLEDHPELVQGEYDPSDAAARTYAVQETVDREAEPIISRYDEQLKRQQALVKQLQFLSPAIALQTVLNDVSGTGSERYQHFLAQVKDYHACWQNYFVPRVFQKEKITAAVYQNSPRFEWQEENLSAVLPRILSGLCGIAIFGLAFVILAAAQIRRFSL